MKIISKLLVVAISLLLAAGSGFGQGQKFREFTERTILDVEALRLPENRALAYAFIGNGVFGSDQRRARALFARSLDEMIAAQKQYSELLATPDFGQHMNEAGYRQGPRRMILLLIASKDAEVALKYLEESRERMFELIENNVTTPDSESFTTERARILASERDLEQSIKTKSFEQMPPEEVVDFVRRNIKSEISGRDLQLIHDIKRSNSRNYPSIVRSVVNEIADRLADDSYKDSVGRSHKFHYFLTSDGDLLQEQLVDQLADKISLYWIKAEDLSYLDRLWSRLEKFVRPRFPNRWKVLEGRITKWRLTNTSSTHSEAEFHRWFSNVKSPEELIAGAGTFKENRERIFMEAAFRIARRGGMARATSFLEDRFPDGSHVWRRNIVLNRLVRVSLDRENFLAAEIHAREIRSRLGRARAMIDVAHRSKSRGGPQHEKLLGSILRSLSFEFRRRIVTLQEVETLLAIAREIARVAPRKSTEFVKPMIPYLNGYTAAFMSDARSLGSKRDQEFILFTGFRPTGAFLLNLGNYLNSLGRKNVEGVEKLISGFAQPEIRVYLAMRFIGPPLRSVQDGTSKPTL